MKTISDTNGDDINMLELKNVSYSAGEENGGVKDILTDVSLTGRASALSPSPAPTAAASPPSQSWSRASIKPTSGQHPGSTGRTSPTSAVTERAKLRHQLRLPAARALQGHHGSMTCCSIAAGQARSPWARPASYLSRGRHVRARLRPPRGERQPLRRRAQAHRDRHDTGPRHQALALRRARGRHRPLELLTTSSRCSRRCTRR